MASRMSGSIKMARKRAIRTDVRKMFDDVRFECVQDTRKRGNAFEQYIHQIMVDQSGGSSSSESWKKPASQNTTGVQAASESSLKTEILCQISIFAATL